MTRPLLISLLAGVCLIPLSAFAGMPFVPCGDPQLFREGDLNVVVLPYSSAAEDGDPTVASIARDLPLLIQAQALRSLLKYGSLGSIALYPEPGRTPCDRARILKVLEGMMRPGSGLIVVWGSIYVEGGEVQLQTYLEFFRKELFEDVPIQVGRHRFLGRPSARSISFGPRTLSSTQLQEIQAAFERATIVRDQPSDTSPGRTMPTRSANGAPFSYRVLSAQGEWIQVEAPGWGGGWLRAEQDSGSAPLAERLPELHFLELVGGYLRTRQAFAAGRVNPAAIHWCETAARRYGRGESSEAAALALAVSEQLLGTLRLTRPDALPVDRAAAAALFAAAARRVPYDAQARILAALTKLSTDYEAAPDSIEPALVETELRKALASDPSNPIALQNLSEFYMFARASRYDRGSERSGDLAPEVVDRRLSSIQAVRAERKNPEAEYKAFAIAELVDLNQAKEGDVARLPGLDREVARAIIAGRPYKTAEALVTRGIISAEKFKGIAGRIYVRTGGGSLQEK